MKTDYKILIKKTFYEILRVDKLSHDFPVHFHNRLCAGKIISGEKYLSLNGKDILLKENDLYFIPPYMAHTCRIKEGKTVSYIILCVDDISKVSEKMILNDTLTLSDDIDHVCSLYRYILKIENSYNKRDNKKINELIKYINENYYKELSVDFLAGITGLTSYHLLHIFKKKVGIPLHQYIIQARIKKTKEYFLQENNLLDIALDCGFYDQSHYIRKFKRHVGTTPQEYYDSIKVF